MIRSPYVYFRCYYLEFIITIRRIIRTNWTMDTLALGGQRVKIWYLKKPSKIIFKSLIAHLVFELGIFKKHTLRRGVCTLKKVIIWLTVFTLNYEIGLQSRIRLSAIVRHENKMMSGFWLSVLTRSDPQEPHCPKSPDQNTVLYHLNIQILA